MDCIQYLQYQEIDDGNWARVDLYSPEADMNLDLTKPRFDFVHQFDINADGTIDTSGYVKGTGAGGRVTLKDDVQHTPSALYCDRRVDPKCLEKQPAVTRLAPVNNQTGQLTAGVYLNGKDASDGTGMSLEREIGRAHV